MFGLNEITWNVFAYFLVVVLSFWYGGLILYAWIRTQSSRDHLFEDGSTDIRKEETLSPIVISSKELPHQLLSSFTENSIPFEVLRFEEDNENKGLNLNLFLEDNNGELTRLIPEIQSQQ